MSVDFNFPLVMTSTGAQPTSPASFNSQLIANVTALVPGYTASLPGSLIEDISSTDVAAMVLIDQARVALINSLTPYGANAFILNQLGLMYGIAPGLPFNTQANVIFTGTVGFVISAGFQVSDGAHLYQLPTATIIGGGGTSPSVQVVAVNSGSWPVPANSITQLITSVPSNIALTVSNPTAGTPAMTAETEQSYRSRVLAAGLSSAQGMPLFLKTQIQNLPGVISTQVAAQVTLGTGIKVLVGGGDDYEIANAIFQSIFNPAILLGSTAHPANNVTVSIINTPDTYNIEFVRPQVQTVTLTINWNTSQTGFTQATAVAALAAPPISTYLNNLGIGAPINFLQIYDIFEQAVVGVLDFSTVIEFQISVYINSTLTPPPANENVVLGDPEGVFTSTASSITITQV